MVLDIVSKEASVNFLGGLRFQTRLYNGGKMKTLHARTIVLLGLLSVISIAVAAQEPRQVFNLPEARVGELYRADIESVLRDKYRLQIEAGTKTAIIQWALADGELTPGLALGTDGNLTGTPVRSRKERIHFGSKSLTCRRMIAI